MALADAAGRANISLRGALPHPSRIISEGKIPVSSKHRYSALAEAEEAAYGLVEATGRHHVVWRSGRGWRVVRLHSFADRWLRATRPEPGWRVLATREQRERVRRPRLLALFSRRARMEAAQG